nr:hypothetical protein 34 [bacterium]
MTSSTDWQLALDLLIARASLDTDLASSLRDQPLKCCADNGVIIPENINLVIADTSEEVIIKTIPGMQKMNQSYKPNNKKLVGSKTYNSGEVEAESVTQEVTEAVTNGETLEGVAIDECTTVTCETEIGPVTEVVVT